MTDYCDDCGKPLDECPMYIETMKIMEGMKSGDIETITVTAEEFLKELKELENETN